MSSRVIHFVACVRIVFIFKAISYSRYIWISFCFKGLLWWIRNLENVFLTKWSSLLNCYGMIVAISLYVTVPITRGTFWKTIWYLQWQYPNMLRGHLLAEPLGKFHTCPLFGAGGFLEILPCKIHTGKPFFMWVELGPGFWVTCGAPSIPPLAFFIVMERRQEACKGKPLRQV